MRIFRLGLLAFCCSTGLASLATLGAPGCTVLTNDALPDDAGTFEGGGDASSTACTTCVQLECAGPSAVCLTDGRCVALRACDNPLGESDGARNQCFCSTANASAPTADAGAEPLAAYAAFASCNDARTCGKCATDCSSRCAGGGRKTTAGPCGEGLDASSDDAGVAADGGDGGDAGIDAAAPPADAPSVDRCQSCVSDKCGDPKKLCAIGTDCAAFLSCASGCTDAACALACGNSHASGRTSALELSSCTLTSCRSACGL